MMSRLKWNIFCIVLNLRDSNAILIAKNVILKHQVALRFPTDMRAITAQVMTVCQYTDLSHGYKCDIAIIQQFNDMSV